MARFARKLRRARGDGAISGAEGSLAVVAALRTSIEETRLTGRDVSDLTWLARVGNNPFSRMLDRLGLDVDQAVFLLGLADAIGAAQRP